MHQDENSQRYFLNGKEVIFLSSERLDLHSELLEEFMERIFGLSPGDYDLSDEVTLGDYCTFEHLRALEDWSKPILLKAIDEFAKTGSRNTEVFWKRIEMNYGVTKSDVQSELLADILAVIARRRGD